MNLSSGGHVTVTHRMLASTFRAFRSFSLSRSDKKMFGKFLHDFPCLFAKLVIISRLFSQQVKKSNVLESDTLMGRNETDWSIFGWFTGINHSRWPIDTISCTISLTVSSLLWQIDTNEILHKICFRMSKQNETQDFPQDSRRAKK